MLPLRPNLGVEKELKKPSVGIRFKNYQLLNYASLGFILFLKTQDSLINVVLRGHNNLSSKEGTRLVLLYPLVLIFLRVKLFERSTPPR